MLRTLRQWILPAALCATFVISAPHTASAQVEPAARVGGLPVYFGVGISRYNLDYGPGRYMEGVVGWAGINLFHGLGVDGSARSIFMNTPLSLTRMEQNTFLGGVHYNFRHIGPARPFARMGAGLGSIEFPSNNPLYTRDTYTVLAPSFGADFRVVDHVYIRGEYEYQIWEQFHGNHSLNPQGWTIGAIYSFRNRNPRPHLMNMN
jgi:opacity protein-like surface antigen